MAEIKILPADPLNHAVAIVDEQGRPTPQFMRQWSDARTADLTAEEHLVGGAETDATETAARIAADAVLQAAVDAEEAARIAADAALQTALDVEEAASAAHAARTDNPHAVTAAQAGAYTIAAIDALLDALAASDIDNDSGVAGLTVAAALDDLEAQIAGVGGGPHAASHQDGGADEINVAGLSGVLADPQPPIIGAGAAQAVAGNDARLTDARTPLAHAASHQNGGADEISVAGLSGLLADPQTAAAHALNSAFHTGTLSYTQLPIGSGTWDIGVGEALTFTRVINIGAALVNGAGYDLTVSGGFGAAIENGFFDVYCDTLTPAFGGNRSGGTLAIPTATAASAELASFYGAGHDGTGWSASYGDLQFIATALFTGTSNPVHAEIWGVAIGSIIRARIAKFAVDGSTIDTALEVTGALTQGSVAVSLVGHTHTWAEVSKTGSSLADLVTRSASDLATGNLAYARLPTGAGSWDAGAGNLITITRSLRIAERLAIGAAINNSYALRLVTAITTGTVQYGAYIDPTFSSEATGNGRAGYFRVNTAAATFTMAEGIGVLVASPVVGSGSSISQLFGLRILAQSAGAQNWAIYCDSSTTSGGVTFRTSALATTAIVGHLFIPSCAGVPTGVPASIPTGQVALQYDSTNNRLYAYSGAWRMVALA